MPRTSVLSNGVHLVTDTGPGGHSAALGLWLVNGTRHQRPGESGYAHLLEHLLFKDTRHRSALELAQRFDAMGGQINAHTGRELTAIHGLVPQHHLNELLALFQELLLEPAFDDHDLAAEREVVCQEMAMVEDTPDEAAEDFAVEQVWPGHPLGLPILGERATLEAATARGVHAYLRRQLQGGRLWVVAGGAVDHDELAAGCEALGRLPAGSAPTVPPPAFSAYQRHVARDGCQTQLQWLMPVPGFADTRRIARNVADALLGGGYSSRLFQELRERRGLVYDVHTRLELYADTGLWLIQTACEPRQADACRKATEAVLADMIEAGPGGDELERVREHIGAALLIERDDPEAHTERLARESIYLGQVPDLDEYLRQLPEVSAGDVRRVLAEAWSRRAHLAWGPDPQRR